MTKPETNDLLLDILSKLDKVVKLLALEAVKGLKEQEKIGLLDSVGFSSADIGKALGKSTANVCTVLKQIKEKSDKVEKTAQKTTKAHKEPETKAQANKQP
jgi:DNA-directed RNA polymerase specialized sigma24 family protein